MDRLIKRLHAQFSLLLIVLTVATAHGIVYIPSDTSIGTWDEVERVFTLDKDVTEPIEVAEDELTVDGGGFTVTGTGLYTGVNLSLRTGVTLRNLNVDGFSIGINLQSSNANIITQSTFQNNRQGIALASSEGNTILNNVSRDNAADGVRLYDARANTLKNNTIEGNSKGVFLISASGNYLTGNTISTNYQGVYCSVANGNEIYNNNFIGNTTQAVTYFSSNVFSLDKPAGGNYWSDWTGPDSDGDGFVDSPYIFTGGTDDLPWVTPDGWISSTPGSPTWPDGSTLVVPSTGLTSLTLVWTLAEHDDGVAEYTIYQDGVEIAAVAGVETMYLVEGLQAGTEYGFKVEACATTGECSEDGPSVVVETLTPREAVEEITEQVLDFDVDDCIEGSLIVKLETAVKALENDKKNSRTVAVNSLEAFINSVEAQRGKKISETDADVLIAAAQEIITALSAG